MRNMPSGKPTVMNAKNAIYSGVLGGACLTMTVVDIHIPIRKTHPMVSEQWWLRKDLGIVPDHRLENHVTIPTRSIRVSPIMIEQIETTNSALSVGFAMARNIEVPVTNIPIRKKARRTSGVMERVYFSC